MSPAAIHVPVDVFFGWHQLTNNREAWPIPEHGRVLSIPSYWPGQHIELTSRVVRNLHMDGNGRPLTLRRDLDLNRWLLWILCHARADQKCRRDDQTD
jgi:hypothetical protein